MQNGGKCQISDICPRSAPCISGPVSSMLEEMRKGAEEDAGRVSRHAVQPDGPQGGAAWTSNTRVLPSQDPWN